jgi:hypothetical protein
MMSTPWLAGVVSYGVLKMEDAEKRVTALRRARGDNAQE